MALRFSIVRILGPYQASKCSGGPNPNLTPVGARGIAGKNLYVPDPNKPKPFNYRKYDYNPAWQIFDKTTLRLDENSKLISVEGSHAIGKSKFAKELAEELGMVHVDFPRMDDICINTYGYDLRKISHLVPERLRPYDEKDLSRNPLGPVPGSADRFFITLLHMKLINHIMSIRHILNTGQGVVMEGSPFSDYATFDAAFKQGWIDIETRKVYKRSLELSLHHIMRPNLILYLDAPVDVVQKNIQARGNEWDKNSPVWTNKQFLSDIYNEMKRNYLKKMQRYCRVLVYDWSEPGETDIVVEDIENLNMENIDYYDDQQLDWRFYTEEMASNVRYRFTNSTMLLHKFNCLTDVVNIDADHLHFETEERNQWEYVAKYLESERYAIGFNTKLGDTGIFWKNRPYLTFNNKGLFHYNRIMPPRATLPFEEDENGFDYEDIKAAQASGNVKLSHNRQVLGY